MLPVPGIAAHLFEAVLRFPAEFLFGFGRIGVTGCDVARASWLDAIGNVDVVHFLEGFHELQNRVAVSSTEVVNT